ncbi:hypothetical protein PLUTE_a1737 [Pseudoalteromonas luteoviolacea DSM 6061]|nr:hypothetical protein [Pseudoalteromonas luteoviolacea DSM 6061]
MTLFSKVPFFSELQCIALIGKFTMLVLMPKSFKISSITKK